MRITATLLQYGEDSNPDAFGDVVRFTDGALYLDDQQGVPLLLNHDQGREAVGVLVQAWTEKDGRVRATFDLIDTPAAQTYATELREGLRKDVSVGVAFADGDYTLEPLDAERTDPWAPQRINVHAAELVETSGCFRGRMPSAHVESVEDPATNDEGNAA